MFDLVLGAVIIVAIASCLGVLVRAVMLGLHRTRDNRTARATARNAGPRESDACGPHEALK